MSNTYLNLEKIHAYQTALELSNIVWEMVVKWEKFAKWTIGKQLVEAADSTSANLAEGFGRYHKKDKIKFYRYSQGSLQEVIDWIEKARIRGLLSPTQEFEILGYINRLPKEINQLIYFTNLKLKH